MTRRGSVLPTPDDPDVGLLIAEWAAFQDRLHPRSQWLSAMERLLREHYPQASSRDLNATARSLAPFNFAPTNERNPMTIARVRTTDGALIDAYLGGNVFVRTVTHHYTGKLAAADESFLLLEDAAWIADDGRFADALESGEPNEVEPFPSACLVSRGAVLDVCEWNHDLPRAQK